MKTLLLALIFPLTLQAGGLPSENPSTKVSTDPFDSVLSQYCEYKNTGFGEVIPAKEDQYPRAHELPDKRMTFSCQSEVKIKYYQNAGIVTIEAIKYLQGGQIDTLASIEGTEEGIKTKELKSLYRRLSHLREKILTRL